MPIAATFRRSLRPLMMGFLVWTGACTHVPPAAPPVEPQSLATGALTPEPAAPAALTGTEALLASLESLASHGLDPSAYGLAEISSLPAGSEARTEAARNAWLLAATHLRHGALDRATLTPRTGIDPTLASLLTGIETSGTVDAFVAALDRAAPARSEYASLRSELARERAGLPLLATPEETAAAVARIDTLRINLERLRWLPSDAGQRYVLANIPAFEVTAVSESGDVERHDAIFGKVSTKTPQFSDQIEYVVFNPWWDVPASIARRDKLPQFRSDPGVISRLGYRIYDRDGKAVDPSGIDWNTVSASAFPYHIRQMPGPSNALGQVKIMFSNPDNVYLHDTSEKALFDREVRTFSSGCIRVKDPLDLAEWVLRDLPGWDRTAIDAAVASGAETRVDLEASIPVHVVYLTASPGADGAIRYSADVYKLDAALLAALDAS